MTIQNGEQIAEELKNIKKLLVLQLLSQGVTQQQVAKALSMNQSSVSRLVPVSFSNIRTSRKS